MSVCRVGLREGKYLGIQPPKSSLFLLVESRDGRSIGHKANGNDNLGAQLVQKIVSGRRSDKSGLG